jgi:hypothetical protein
MTLWVILVSSQIAGKEIAGTELRALFVVGDQVL